MRLNLKVIMKTWLNYVLDNKKLSFCLKYALLLTALVVMTYLTFLTALELVKEFHERRTVASVEVKDHSNDGIYLPHGTICIKFHDLPVNHFNNRSTAFTKFEKLLVKSLKAKQADFLTYQLSYNDDVHKHEIWNEVLAESLNEAHRNEYANAEKEVRKRLCKYLNIKFIMPNHGKNHVQLCHNITHGHVPFVVNNYDLFCFRIPLYWTPITQVKSELYDDVKYANLYDDVKFAQKSFNVSLTPLYLLRKLPNVYKHCKKVTVVAYFPENRLSYRLKSLSHLATGKDELKHEITFPKDFGYMRHLPLFVDLSVKSKYNRVDDQPCVDVYNKTDCIIKCLEANFTEICNCRRYLTDWFGPSDQPYCTRKHYVTCGRSRDQHIQVKQCESRCNFCARLLYQHKVFTTFMQAKEGVKKRYKSYFCDLYDRYQVDQGTTGDCETFYRKLDIGETDHEIIFKLSSMVKNYGNISDREERERFKRYLLGEVTYTFFMNTMVYQEINEILFLSFKSLIAHIGGLVNLYLGVSGLSLFFAFVKGLKRLKRYWNEQRELIQRQRHRKIAVWKLLVIMILQQQKRSQNSNGVALAAPLLTYKPTRLVYIERTSL